MVPDSGSSRFSDKEIFLKRDNDPGATERTCGSTAGGPISVSIWPLGGVTGCLGLINCTYWVACHMLDIGSEKQNTARVRVFILDVCLDWC